MGIREPTTISMNEHEEAVLPLDVLREDGALDLYVDVQARFEISYKRNRQRFVIRSGGWVGYIPISQSYALDVDTRVPVSNLERILARSGDASVMLFENYTRPYEHTKERPQRLYDMLADQFLGALDLVWRNGVAKAYVRTERRSAAPFGRIDPFRSKHLTLRTGRPEAIFSAFVRTPNCRPNQILCTAVRRLVALYTEWQEQEEQRARLRRLREASRRFDALAVSASDGELGWGSILCEIRGMPVHRQGYVRALELANVIVGGYGVKIRGGDGGLVLPAVLVDMAATFERYARGVLKRNLEQDFVVRDGNLSGDDGGRRVLFAEFFGSGDNPWATPDIVVGDGRGIRVIIDVKYKPAKNMPDRNDMNQVLSYGITYGCQDVMIVYPNVPSDGIEMLYLGLVGSIRVYRGSLDLSAQDLEAEEERFARSVADSVRRRSEAA